MATVVCAIVMVKRPRPRGKPVVCSEIIKKNKKERPMTTSGMTKGETERISKKALQRKDLKRVNKRAHNVPMQTERLAAQKATFNELRKARKSIWLEKSFLYQRRDAPPQTPKELVLLNENSTTKPIGTYKKA